MFKTFFGKVWSAVKATPKTLVKVAKDTATTIAGIVYFVVWSPFACLMFYASFFKHFGEYAIDTVRGFVKKATGFKASSATAEAV